MRVNNDIEPRCGEIVRMLVEKNIDDKNKVISYTYNISYRFDDKTIETSIINRNDFDLYSKDNITHYCTKSGNVHEELYVILFIITSLLAASTIGYLFNWLTEL
jgi:hypothetical protein